MILRVKSKRIYLKDIYPIVDGIVKKYWVGFPSYITDSYTKKTAFEIRLLQNSLKEIKGKTVIDVGGGWGCFTASCAALGMNAILIDDFNDPWRSDQNDPRQSLPSDFGFKRIKRDIIVGGLGTYSEPVDAITSFDLIEHLHASPKKFLHDAMRELQKDGVLILGAPNCVNLRKRLTVPFGRGQWSDFYSWYEPKIFRGHVREPDVQDLKKIAEDISLCDYQILGRNWLGFGSPSKLVRLSTRISHKILNHFPSVCSDIYLLGFKR
jgi:cyclopropane fatty-acyl-phospholipid synthase-like methyltransferase